MNSRLYLIMFCVLLIGATSKPISFYADEGFTYEKIPYNTTVVGNNNAITLSNPYFSTLMRDGDCKNGDIYLFCIVNFSYDRVEHYPHEVFIEMEITNLCSSCKRYGEACTRNVDCAGFCVHGICRPQSTWCGDGHCDVGEACPEDCALPEELDDPDTTEELIAAPDDPVDATPEPEDPVDVVEPELPEDVPAPEDPVDVPEVDAPEEVPAVDPDVQDDDARTEPAFVAPELVPEERAPDSAPEQPSRASRSPTANQPNWIGGIIVLVVGIVLIIFTVKHRKKHSGGRQWNM